jgi:hypothetical protein
MNSQYDASLVHQFLFNTPESALRKMLINPQFTQVHFNLLFKMVKGGSETDFCDYFYNSSFPKLKFSASEIAIKENFWPICIAGLNQHGLLQPAQKMAA